MEDQSYDHDKSSTKVQSMKVVNFGIRERGIAGIRFHQSNDDLIQYPKPSNKSHLARIKKVYMRTGWTGIATTLLNFSLTSFVPSGNCCDCYGEKMALILEWDMRLKTEQWAGAARNVADRAELWEHVDLLKAERDECDQSSASTGMERLESVLQIVPIRAYLARPVIVAAKLGSGIIWQKWIIDGISLSGGSTRAYQYWRGRARGTTTGGSLNSYIDQAWSHLLDTDPPPFGPPTIISPHHIWNLVLVDELLFSLDGTDPKVIAMVTTKGAGEFDPSAELKVVAEMDESWHSQGLGTLRMGVMEEAQ
ncbi:hypothetical protein BY996DRAFT_6586367 [Phakopsora pachyrhizi]|nr:hypothetical protein BY996DRAFT_6586367 [Phakopsora pachyrhizi]